MLMAESVGTRALRTGAELRDLVGSVGFFWLDIFSTDDAVRMELLGQLGLDASDIPWALRFGQALRLVMGQHGLRAVTWLAEPPGTVTEVHLVGSRRCIVTVWGGDPAALDEARQHFVDRAAELGKSHFRAAAIVLQLLLASLDQAISTLDVRLQAARERLQEAAGADLPALTGQLHRLQSRWADFDRYSSAVRFAIVGVEAVPGMDPRGAVELNDYAEQVEDIERRLHDRSQWASNILQDYAAAIAQRQGDQINRLTLVSLIFLPLTFITGFFGMNFGWMNETLGSAAAFAVLGVALPAGCVILTGLWLRRRKLI
ncbi:MAG TPA: CorA family divalent cation transporter [Candidatus Binatia bacterium]|nr:CorA family divalent cation transporter [Candidatus Binatia bacterium]